MARAKKPLQVQRIRHQHRAGAANFTLYASPALTRALTDVAQAHGISRAEYVRRVLEADQAVADQMAFYAELEQMGTDVLPDGASPDGLPGLESDQRDTNQTD